MAYTNEDVLADRVRQAIEKQSPATFFKTIAPHDTNVVDGQIRSLFISAAGTVVAEDHAGNNVTFDLDAGTVLPIRPRLIKAASTATIIGLW